MSVKQLHFKHKTGSIKPIPGISHGDTSPRMKTVTKLIPETGKYSSVLEAVPDHVVKITLANDEYVPLTPEETAGLPQRIIDKLEDERVEKWSARKKANDEVLVTLALYQTQGEIEILGEFEKDESEVQRDGSVIVSPSEIMIADYLDRGIPLPDNLVREMPAERVKAAGVKAKIVPDKSEDK